MGFFFTQVKKPKSKGLQKKLTNEALSKIGCAACTLNKACNKSPKMQPTIAKETKAYFLGINPGKEEDLKGKPFVGPSGKLLRYCIPDDLEEYCSFDNVVRDRTPQVKKPDGSVGDREPTEGEVASCRQYIIKSIEEAKPKLIIGLGIIPQQWVLNNADQQGLRGRIFTVKIGKHSCYFMPTYHPSRVLRSASEQRNKQNSSNQRYKPPASEREFLNTYNGRTFKFDLDKAFKFVRICEYPVIETEQQIRDDIITFNGNDYEDLLILLDEARKAPVKSIDIETQGLRPYANDAQILTIAISFDDINFSFAWNHPHSKWTVKQLKELEGIFKGILKDNTQKIYHNGTFECEWFAYFFGKDTIKINTVEDTQVQAHFIDERRGAGQSNDDNRRATYLSLGFLINQYFGIPFKQWFDLDKKDMANAPIKETLVYNAADTRQTLRLWHTQNAILRTRGLYNAYKGAVKRQGTIALIELLGVPVNQTITKRLQQQLADEISVIEAEIQSLDVVRQYVEDKGSFNPAGHDAIFIFRDYLKRDEVKIQDGSKVRWSVDKNILEKIDHPLAKLLVRFRNKCKMKATYVDGLLLPDGKYIHPDGKLHCNFNATFTTTGRTSSDEPNMQNFPKRSDAWIREQITAPEDHTIVACDFGQLEACCAAMCSQDPTMVKYLWEEYDVHRSWAIRIANDKEVQKDISDPKVLKAYRSHVKGSFVFASFYGAGAFKVSQGLGISIELAEKLQEELWEMFPVYKQWQDKVLRDYRKNGYVESPTGRRRHYPLISTEAINSAIQGFASDLVVDAMCALSELSSNTNRWYLHPVLNIHDDLTFIIPDKYLDECDEIIRKMLTPEILKYIPEKSQVPLSVEMSMGKDWYHMTDMGKFYSNKDLG